MESPASPFGSQEEVNRMDFAQLRYAINEAYARHGADFPEKPAIKQHFSQFTWYHPRFGVSFDTIEREFLPVERANIEVLGKYRDLRRP